MNKSTPARSAACDLLVVSPHSDDAEIGMAGTLALLASRGRRVWVVDLTRGELGSNATPDERWAEATAAAAVLGLAGRLQLELPDGFVDRMYTTVADIIDSDATSINDIKLEAGAFLCLARQSERVDLGFVRRVVAIQNEDGGWGTPAEGAGNPDESSWHSTILALMILMHVRFPDAQVAAGQ